MARIGGKHTRPELAVRKSLHSLGFRFRLHVVGLPGRPDLVFPSRRAVVFVHGCYWHGHDCHLFRFPAGNAEFWRLKLERNRTRDANVRAALLALGWRVMTIWECSIRGRGKIGIEAMAAECSRWLRSSEPEGSISGSHRGGRCAATMG